MLQLDILVEVCLAGNSIVFFADHSLSVCLYFIIDKLQAGTLDIFKGIHNMYCQVDRSVEQISAVRRTGCDSAGSSDGCLRSVNVIVLGRRLVEVNLVCLCLALLVETSLISCAVNQ